MAKVNTEINEIFDFSDVETVEIENVWSVSDG